MEMQTLAFEGILYVVYDFINCKYLNTFLALAILLWTLQEELYGMAQSCQLVKNN